MADNLNKDYVIEIYPRNGLLDFNLKEVLSYKDLLWLLVRRDFVSAYKQTILGPLWFIIQPLATTLVFVVVFGGIANISTDGMPQILFYLAGIIGWNYFSEVFSITSETFVHNAYIFGKVYFPRIIVPLSNVFSNLITFGVQFLLFLLIYGYYYFFQESQIYPNLTVLLTPILVLITGGLGLGLGLIFTSLTTKYRDFTYVTGFGIQLAMYATPIIYPTSLVEGNMKILILANPMSSVIEAFRYSFLGVGSFSWTSLVYSFVAMFLILIVGFVVFNKVEKNFIDTV